MAALNIDQQLHAVFGNRQQRRRKFAGHRALRQLQTLFFTHRHIGAIVDSALRKALLQRGENRRALILRAGREQLQHQEIAEAIDGDARQAVRFAGDQAIAVQPIFLRQPVAPLPRLLETAYEEGDIN